MSGTTTPPTAAPDTAAVTEDGTLVATGNILANDVDGNGKTLSLVSVNGITVSGSTTIVGTYGTLVIQPNGQYTYTLNNSQANVRALSNGQIIPDVFSYVVSDGQTYTQTTTQTIQNLIPWSEAFDNASTWVPFAISGTKPTITANADPGPNGGASTADKVTITSANTGLYFQTAVTGQYTFSVWVRLISGDGDFSFSYYDGATGATTQQAALATGTWQRLTWTFTGDGNTFSNVALMHSLSQSASGTFEFWGAQLNPGATAQTYVPTSGSATTTTTTVSSPLTIGSTLTVNVTGNTPVATPDTAAVIENGTLVATGNVLTNDTDGAGKTLSVSAVNGVTLNGSTTIVGTYGTLVIQPNGQYTYTLNNSQANVQALSAGQTVPDVFNYVVSDGQTYTQTTTQTVQNLIPWSEAFDNGSTWVPFAISGTNPTIVANADPGPNGGASTADKVTITSANSGLYFQTAVTGQYTFSVWVRLISGDGDFSFSYYDGATGSTTQQAVLATSTWQRLTWTFTGDGNTFSNIALMHSLSQSSSGTFEFWGAQLNPGATAQTYVPTSGSAVTTTVASPTNGSIGSTLTVGVTGAAANAPPVATADTKQVTEDGTQVVTGNVLTNDTASGGRTLTVVSVNGTAVNGSTTIVGTYGTLVIQPNGQYTYTLANSQANVRALANGQMVPDVFTYAITDGTTSSQTTTQTSQNLITQSEVFGSPVWVVFSPTACRGRGLPAMWGPARTGAPAPPTS
ncbi:MAG: Ig-like domain-containing protein [Acetobacteraceae bacterium]